MNNVVFPILIGAYGIERYLTSLRDGNQPFLVVAIPWALISPHESQARLNHGQSLAMLASRGGLAAAEALAVIEDRTYHRQGFCHSHKLLTDKVNAHHLAEWQVMRDQQRQLPVHFVAAAKRLIDAARFQKNFNRESNDDLQEIEGALAEMTGALIREGVE